MKSKFLAIILCLLFVPFCHAGVVIGNYYASAADTTAPTLQSATIGTDGETWTLVFDETVNIGSGGNGGWSVTMTTAGSVTLTYSSGDGSDTLVYTGGTTVNSGDTASNGLDYTQPGDGIEDNTGNDLANIDDASITNNSTQGGDNCSGGEEIGYTPVGDTNTVLSDGNSRVQGIYTVTCTGDLDTGYFYGMQGNDNAVISVYKDNGDGIPDDTADTLVGSTGTITTDGDGTDQYYSSAFTSGSLEKDDVIFIVVYIGDGGWRYAYDAASTAAHTDLDVTCNGFDSVPSEITDGGGCTYPTDDNVEMSLYITMSAP